ncbi:putative S-adenosyl-L-methionine-dependent RNA methyltransferase RSM22, mitochondrial [Nakaseomyces bracarensis]|uniref:S-adenosyl-L-methionine-dependent RNA methyltransferase RSM22, mitochondrial n=1 Tax=Nakaseomyces bracarensis TaxID=273131 RepID=A0ABR4NSB7_9SACH
MVGRSLIRSCLQKGRLPLSTAYGALSLQRWNSTFSKEVLQGFDVDENVSIYRKANGELRHGTNAREARLQPETLEGRANRSVIELNKDVASVINDHILSQHIPNNVRRVAMNYFNELQEKNSLHRPCKTPMEVDSHLASVFLQNYAAIYQSLSELKKRVPDFRPRKILDVGYGPATGIVAFNDVMGPDYKPDLKDAVIIGNLEMQKRAKIILSRQFNEIPDAEQNIYSEDQNIDEIPIKDDVVGPITTKKIKIMTNLRSSSPSAQQYDLIIITHQLLKSKEKFNTQIDENITHFLNVLAPGGHIVIIERGNPIGYETVAKARQIILRPENFSNEVGKIPRPWMKGALSNMFRENSNEYNVSKSGEFKPNYYLTEIAPYPHHAKDVLQTGKPIYYEFKDGKALKFINFQKMVKRPKFSIELKRGKLLSASWERENKRFLDLRGSGRRNSNDYEIINYCYLIMERSKCDENSIEKIESERKRQMENEQNIVAFQGDGTSLTWPRIIKEPIKRKGHVILHLMAPSGKIEKWTIPKSFSKEIYHDARKAEKGDLWPFGAKTKVLGMASLNVEKFKELERKMIIESRREKKHDERDISISLNEINNMTLEQVEQLQQSDGSETIDNMKKLAKAYGYYFDKKKK